MKPSGSPLVPPAGIEPAHPPPEGGALSPELRGRTSLIYQRVAPLGAWHQNRLMMESAYFATGCFWGAERRFWQFNGVIKTSVGYMGGTRPQPNYEQVCTGVTGHAEIVWLTFDTEVISYQRLLEEFWTMHDPTTLNSQGNDIGTQYRSVIFTTTPEQMQTAQASKQMYQNEITTSGYGSIVTEILSANGVTYWPAEEYHQRYLEKNPNGYDCHSSTGVAYPTSARANQ